MNLNKEQNLEKLLAILILFATFIFIPYRILSVGYMPTDDANRHIAFSTTNQTWSDVLVIKPSLSSDHNAGWHSLLRFIHRYLKISKEGLIYLSVIGLFCLFNITGTILSPNKAAWIILLTIMFLFDRSIILRTLSGRPFIISNIITLILLKIWFLDSDKEDYSLKYLGSIILLTIAVWLHGTWYTFLILPMALLLSGEIKQSLELSFIILLSTILGAFLTGEFNQFLYFHYTATLNIFSEKIYNWQLVTEFAEGNINILWLVPTFFITMLSIYSKKMKLNDLSKDRLFICILLCWLLSLKVIRFWVDWGTVALMFWLSHKLSELIEDMKSIKKPFMRNTMFILAVLSSILFMTNSAWNNQKKRAEYSVDFSKPEFAEYKPLDGGIIYNDDMNHFYYQYYNDPEGKYKYVLGFEPVIMTDENRMVYREIIYSYYNYKSYKIWIDKLTEKDRIFVSIDLSKNYPELDWIRAGKHLYIGKEKKEIRNKPTE
ncbi:MAG: hypothetical protein II961_09310 [Candidatus Riflebacteria bacterium]|nr:hypothetical protein [Candidatus Riflebacteria bacterium]